MTATDRIDIVPATRELLERFYGGPPIREVNAVAALKGGKIIGVAGVFHEGEVLMAFADMTDELREDKRAIVRGIHEVMQLIYQHGKETRAIADEIPGANILLTHCGFQRVNGEEYVWQTL